jgi:hypothetical protein
LEQEVELVGTELTGLREAARPDGNLTEQNQEYRAPIGDLLKEHNRGLILAGIIQPVKSFLPNSFTAAEVPSNCEPQRLCR